MSGLYEDVKAHEQHSEFKATDLISQSDDVPDPFLVDDPDDPVSEDEEDDQPLAPPPPVSSLPTYQIPLNAPPTSTGSQFPPFRNKQAPPVPTIEVDSDADEEEQPEIYLPGLTAPTMFLPIPNTDPLTTLLNKHVATERRPFRDTAGDWQRHDFNTLVMTNSWRALARMARDRLVSSDPEDLSLVLGLWYLRLSCLARLRFFNQTSAECSNLYAVLNSLENPEARTWLFDRVLPFELDVMYARLRYWSGDHMGYLDVLYALLKKCRLKARAGASDPDVVSMWKERGARITLIISSQLVEMKDLTAAATILEPLCTSNSAPSLQSAVARIYLQSGNIQTAKKHFEEVDNDPNTDQQTKDVNAAILACANGDWKQAEERLTEVLEMDSENFMVTNNLAVSLLCQGRLKEGIQVLEKAKEASPSTVLVAEPFLFNLSTLYELRSANSIDMKRDLLVDVAKWSGDGLKTACLKMPTT